MTTTAVRRRRRWLRLVWISILTVLAVAGVVAGIGMLTTSFEEQPLRWVRPAKGEPPPGWTRPCWRTDPPHGVYSLPCGRISGRVVSVEERDPDGDGDAHVVVLAGPHVVVVKLPRSRRDGALPGIGGRFSAVGLVEDGPLSLPSLRVPRPGEGRRRSRPAGRAGFGGG